MKINVVTLVLGLLLGLFLGSVGGYLTSEWRGALAQYQRDQIYLVDNIIVGDALRSGKAEAATMLIKSRIVADFYDLIQLHEKYGFKDSKVGRCMITKKVRALKAANELYPAIEGYDGESISFQYINSYLDGNCPGAPAKDNWAQ